MARVCYIEEFLEGPEPRYVELSQVPKNSERIIVNSVWYDVLDVAHHTGTCDAFILVRKSNP